MTFFVKESQKCLSVPCCSFFMGKLGIPPSCCCFGTIFIQFSQSDSENHFSSRTTHQFKDPWQSLVTSCSNQGRDRLLIFAIKKLSLRVLLARFNRTTVIRGDCTAAWQANLLNVSLKVLQVSGFICEDMSRVMCKDIHSTALENIFITEVPGLSTFCNNKTKKADWNINKHCSMCPKKKGTHIDMGKRSPVGLWACANHLSPLPFSKKKKKSIQTPQEALRKKWASLASVLLPRSMTAVTKSRAQTQSDRLPALQRQNSRNNLESVCTIS